jgi:hypothetical protein
MELKGENELRLPQISNIERATSKKARESWQMFTIMAEFIVLTDKDTQSSPYR